MIISSTALKVVATLLCKNEEDIIGANIEHHVNQGVKHLIVTDNSSTDRTREIVARYPEVVELIDEPGDDHNQSKWVTRMARLACKLDPDWIVHMDADELWGGLSQLRRFQTFAVGCTGMFLHPPMGRCFDLKEMRYYLDFSDIGEIPGECKVAHRPDPEVVVTHGNHGVVGNRDVSYTNDVWRHHYPVRSCKQLIRKAVEGHEALMRRKVVCERWRRWYNLYHDAKLGISYNKICESWGRMIQFPNSADLLSMLEFWSTPEVVNFFGRTGKLPAIGEWPRSS